MAITINGMNSEETANLTEEMRVSGDVWDLSDIPRLKVDKHSTGGVWDKVSLIFGPMIASFDENKDPADKKLYTLRDVAGTVQSIPLIDSSIMSKKLSSDAYCILLDVKCGKGAFMKAYEDAKKLSI